MRRSNHRRPPRERCCACLESCLMCPLGEETPQRRKGPQDQKSGSQKAGELAEKLPRRMGGGLRTNIGPGATAGREFEVLVGLGKIS